MYATKPGFVFHDSCGFEAGSVEELEKVKTFIAEKSKKVAMKDRLHVIWYCLPTDNDRPLSPAETAFFEFGTSSVPVVAIFTKYDGLETKAFVELREKMPRDEAKKAAAQQNCCKRGLSIVSKQRSIPPRARSSFEMRINQRLPAMN